jgi:hypothetical protein
VENRVIHQFVVLTAENEQTEGRVIDYITQQYSSTGIREIYALCDAGGRTSDADFILGNINVTAV